MKIVNLAEPAIVDGALRYPVENPLTVSDDEAVRLSDEKKLDGDAEDLPEDNPAPAKPAASKKEA